MRVLIVEDEVKLSNNIVTILKQHRYEYEQVFDGTTALDRLYEHHYDLVILDIMLPDIDGITLVQQLRNSKNTIPILMLTARDRIQDRIEGLDAGADDYMSKPFSNLELLARIRSLLRRQSFIRMSTVAIGDLTLNSQKREVICNQKYIELTAKEFALLELLMMNPDTILTRLQISEYLWGESSLERSASAINAHIKNLRKKLCNEIIETVPTLGYKLRSTL